MEPKLGGTADLVTGASSGLGAATARGLAEDGASVALAVRRKDRLEAVAAEIDRAGGTALVVEADITDRAQAEAVVQQTVELFGDDLLMVHAFDHITLVGEQMRLGLLSRVKRYLGGDAPAFSDFELVEFRDDARRVMPVIQEDC